MTVRQFEGDGHRRNLNLIIVIERYGTPSFNEILVDECAVAGDEQFPAFFLEVEREQKMLLRKLGDVFRTLRVDRQSGERTGVRFAFLREQLLLGVFRRDGWRM